MTENSTIVLGKYQKLEVFDVVKLTMPLFSH